MNLAQALRELEKSGTAQNRKVYARHGVRGEQYGVSFSNLGKMKRAIRVDHELALELWKTANHDARVLATMIADPESLTLQTAERWARDLDNYVLTDALTLLIAQTAFADTCMHRWRLSGDEWIASAGWNLVASLAGKPGKLDEGECREYLADIEFEIHDAKNRVRHCMNQALIVIGLRSSALEREAIGIAKRIGKVDVDHGETSCKTPDAIAYIAKTKAHYAKRIAGEGRASGKPAKSNKSAGAKKTKKASEAAKPAAKKSASSKVAKKVAKKSAAKVAKKVTKKSSKRPVAKKTKKKTTTANKTKKTSTKTATRTAKKTTKNSKKKTSPRRK